MQFFESKIRPILVDNCYKCHSHDAAKHKGGLSVEFGAAVAFTEEVSPGVVYKYKFSTGEIKKPIQEAITACGWTYKGVAFGKL